MVRVSKLLEEGLSTLLSLLFLRLVRKLSVRRGTRVGVWRFEARGDIWSGVFDNDSVFENDKMDVSNSSETLYKLALNEKSTDQGALLRRDPNHLGRQNHPSFLPSAFATEIFPSCTLLGFNLSTTLADISPLQVT